MAVAVDSSATALAVRDCSTGETRVLNGTDDAGFPFWSPDGKWIAFFTDGKLRKIPAAGGPVITVCAAHAGRGGSWSERGEIVFAADITGPIYRVSPDGGAPVAVTHVQSANWTNRMPYFLPDGRHFLFVERESVTDPYGHVMVASIDGGPAKKLLEQGSNPQYSGGYLLCSRDGTLCAQRLDAGSLELKGSVIPLFGGLEYYNPRDVANFSVSHNGVLVYRLENHEPVRFAWIDRSGHEVSTIGEPGQFEFQQLSRDSRTLLVIRHDTDHRGQDLWTIDVDRGTTTRSTQIDLEGNLSGTFSPDGTRLAVSSPAVAGKGGDLWIQPVSGSQIERTVLKTSRFYVQEWSPDGKYLIGDEQVEGTGHNVFLVRLDEASTSSKPMLNAVYDERPQGVSADGKWLAYSSTESGTLETYVTDFPSATRKYQISQGGSSTAVWSADGRELFYYAGSGWVSVSLLAGPTLQISAPKRVSLPEGAYLCGTRGSQLLVLRPDHTPAVEPLRVVQIWHGPLPW
jgi:Tol biopolymer transport system component